MSERHGLLLGLKRGAARRCPTCGAGRLFRGYLKIEPTCAACGHDNGRYPSDDAPPYFTILIVGHLFVAPLLAIPGLWALPTAVLLGATVPAMGVATLVLLPFVKGAVVGAQWGVARNDARDDG